MNRLGKIITIGFLLWWSVVAIHFGVGQLETSGWVHYVVEGYFLFSVMMCTWIWFKIRELD